jgi:hypothetical protein
MGTGALSLGGKVQPARGADHSPPSNAEVKKEWELYVLSPKAPPWHVTGPLYLYQFPLTCSWQVDVCISGALVILILVYSVLDVNTLVVFRPCAFH